MSTHNNDVVVDFEVLMPPGVGLTARTVNGSVEAESLQGPVEAHTVNGHVDVSTSRHAEASTVNGSRSSSDLPDTSSWKASTSSYSPGAAFPRGMPMMRDSVPRDVGVMRVASADETYPDGAIQLSRDKIEIKKGDEIRRLPPK